MGGGGNSSPPVDVAPGGGTYPTNLFGQAYNPDWYSGSSGVSQAFSTAGSQIAQSSQASPPGAETQLQPFIPPQSQSNQPMLIPAGGGQNNDILRILQSILGGGGLG